MKTKCTIIPVFIPHKGCPFDCIYCNQKLISGLIEDVTEQGMRNTINDHLSTIRNSQHIEIAFYGGSFTGIEKRQQEKYLEIANEYIADGLVKGIRLSTRPDYINDKILDLLKKYNVSTIELGVQSLDENVLITSCRGHSVDDVIKSSRLIREYGFVLGIQTMIGLPGDSVEKDMSTAQKVIELNPSIVRIYPALVIKGTYLEKMYRSGEYKPLELNEAVDICSKLLNMYKTRGIRVIRVGLQATESINLNSDVIAGPFHPAFRQLVESRITLDRIEQIILENQLEHQSEIIIKTDSKNVSNVVGQNKGNIESLKRKFGYHQVKVKVLSGECSGITVINK